MMPVSGVNTGAAQPLAAAGKAPGAPEVRKPEEEVQNRRLKPVMDEYVPEKKRDKDEVWACNTDKVDRELEKLKKKRQELERQLNTETDEAKIKELERQLSQVEQELKQKDSDTYRRQHASFTQLS